MTAPRLFFPPLDANMVRAVLAVAPVPGWPADITPLLPQICGPHSFACFLAAERRPLGMGGLVVHWPGRAEAWAAVAPGMPRRCWPAITARVELVLRQAQAAGYRRIEAAVDPLRSDACGWVRRLGFEAYGLLDRYTPDDRDLIGVVRLARRHHDYRRAA